MRKKTFFVLMTILCLPMSIVGQTQGENIKEMETRLDRIQQKQAEMDKQVKHISNALSEMEQGMQNIKQRNEFLWSGVDSLKSVCDNLGESQESDRKNINGKLNDTSASISKNKDLLENRTIWGGVIAFAILAIVAVTSYLLGRRIKSGTSTLDEVRKAQDALQDAQAKMQEESVKLDSKFIEIIEKQLSVSNAAKRDEKTTDHSLALKVADEIAKIELNLSRMDPAIRGYKQLTKAVQRLKDNFMANGYEIVDMLGKPYNDGMKVIANFVIDEDLEEGKQIITGIIKPQVNYNGKMIQAAQITVSQNI